MLQSVQAMKFYGIHQIRNQEKWRNSFYESAAAAAAKSLQSCPTLCDPIDSSPPGSSVQGIFQARGLGWGAIAFSMSLLRTFLPPRTS